MKAVLASAAALLGLALVGAFLMTDRDDPSASGGAAPPSRTSTAATASSGAGSSSSTTVATPSEAATSGLSLPSQSSETSSASAGTTSSASSPAPSIETASSFYFGQGFETIRIPGTYRGGDLPARLRVMVRGHRGGWTEFPLPVVTERSGKFTASVDLGRGRYRLRLVDPASGTTSRLLTVLVL